MTALPPSKPTGKEIKMDRRRKIRISSSLCAKLSQRSGARDRSGPTADSGQHGGVQCPSGHYAPVLHTALILPCSVGHLESDKVAGHKIFISPSSSPCLPATKRASRATERLCRFSAHADSASGQGAEAEHGDHDRSMISTDGCCGMYVGLEVSALSQEYVEADHLDDAASVRRLAPQLPLQRHAAGPDSTASCAATRNLHSGARPFGMPRSGFAGPPAGARSGQMPLSGADSKQVVGPRSGFTGSLSGRLASQLVRISGCHFNAWTGSATPEMPIANNLPSVPAQLAQASTPTVQTAPEVDTQPRRAWSPRKPKQPEE